MNEILKKIADLKEQMRSILDESKAQGRNALSDEEQKRFEVLEDECKMLGYRLRASDCSPAPSMPVRVAKRFAEHVVDLLGSSRQDTISLRAIQNEPSIHDASTPILYQDLQKPLEQGLILNRLGGRILYDVHGEPMWPFVSGVEAEVAGENEAASEKNLEFSTVKSTPKRIALTIPVSRRAIHQSNLNLYGLVMEQLGLGVARKLNRILCETSAHGDYSGPFVAGTMAGGTELTRSAAAFTYGDVLELEHAVLNKLTDSVGTDPCFIMNYKMAQKLRSTPIVAGQSEMILTLHRDGNVHYGMMCGRRVELSNYVPDGHVYFGDFRYLGLPQYGDINIIVDPYSGAKTNTVNFTLNTDMDMVKIRKEAFAMSKGA